MRISDLHPAVMNIELHSELSSLEETRRQFNGDSCAIKSAEGRMRPVCALGINVHQDFYVVAPSNITSAPVGGMGQRFDG